MSTLFQSVGNSPVSGFQSKIDNPDSEGSFVGKLSGPEQTFLKNNPTTASIFAVGKVRDEFLKSLEVPTFHSEARPLPPLRAGKVRSKSLLGGG